jgi:NADPH-dependent curcumin reductase CurA
MKSDSGEVIMTEAKARQIVLAARPQGKPQLTDFRLEEIAIPTPGAGQVAGSLHRHSGGTQLRQAARPSGSIVL